MTIRRTHVIWLLFLVLLVTNLFLIRQNLFLRELVPKDFSELDFLKPGDIVEAIQPLEVQGGFGRALNSKIQASGQKTLLLYFSPSCRYSNEQLPYWKNLIDRLTGYSVVGLIPENETVPEAVRLLREFDINESLMPVHRISQDQIDQLKLHITPMTLVLDERGAILKYWAGKWRYPTIREALSHFRLID